MVQPSACPLEARAIRGPRRMEAHPTRKNNGEVRVRGAGFCRNGGSPRNSLLDDLWLNEESTGYAGKESQTPGPCESMSCKSKRSRNNSIKIYVDGRPLSCPLDSFCARMVPKLHADGDDRSSGIPSHQERNSGECLGHPQGLPHNSRDTNPIESTRRKNRSFGISYFRKS